MPEPTNDDRAEWALEALDTFTGLSNCDDSDAVADLLANLMHLCDLKEEFGGFDEALSRARMNFAIEKAESETEGC